MPEGEKSVHFQIIDLKTCLSIFKCYGPDKVYLPISFSLSVWPWPVWYRPESCMWYRSYFKFLHSIRKLWPGREIQTDTWTPNRHSPQERNIL